MNIYTYYDLPYTKFVSRMIESGSAQPVDVIQMTA